MVAYPSGCDIKSVTNIPSTPNMRATVAAGDVAPAIQGEFLDGICWFRYLVLTYSGRWYKPITPNMRATLAAGDVTPATQG